MGKRTEFSSFRRPEFESLGFEYSSKVHCPSERIRRGNRGKVCRPWVCRGKDDFE